MTEELKPCPFCGDEARIVLDRGRNAVGVECSKCTAQQPPSWDVASEEWAVRAWNTRLSHSAEKEALIGQAQFLLDRLVDHEVRMTSDADAREWHGHVTPAMARLRAVLSPVEGEER